MTLGSNNSMTYLSPSTWWAKILRFIGKCQSVSHEDQYKFYGVRFFDIKLYVSKHNHMVIKNGDILYNTFSLYNVLNFFNSMGDVTVRITLDVTFDEMMHPDYPSIANKFKETCGIIEQIYPDIKYVGGYRTYDKKCLYEFKYEKENGTPLVVDECTHSKLERLLPFLTASNNRKLIEKYKNSNGFLLLNFVNKK